MRLAEVGDLHSPSGVLEFARRDVRVDERVRSSSLADRLHVDESAPFRLHPVDESDPDSDHAGTLDPDYIFDARRCHATPATEATLHHPCARVAFVRSATDWTDRYASLRLDDAQLAEFADASQIDQYDIGAWWCRQHEHVPVDCRCIDAFLGVLTSRRVRCGCE